MAAQTWTEWLSGLWARPPPPPGSHEAFLEELRLSALLNKELRKPAGQRDEELAHKLRVECFSWGLKNAQAALSRYKRGAWSWEHSTRQCCAAAQWASQRIAASYRALAACYELVTQQKEEELAAAKARRLPVIAAQPTLRLELPGALQQAPPRLDMCSECARMVQQMELDEEKCRAIADSFIDRFRWQAELGQSAPGAAAASPGARDGAAAAPAAAAPAPPAPPPPADPPGGEAQQGKQPTSQKQQQQQQDCSGSGGGGGGAEHVPMTPKQQQQQHSTSDEEQH